MSADAVVEDLPDYLGDRKQHVEAWDQDAFHLDRMAGALIDTVCPNCQHTVGAFVIDGPDPVFADLQCPRDVCGHEWSERVS